MSGAEYPSMEEILDALERLADRVSNGSGERLDGFVSLSIRRVGEELRRFIPGLDYPPDPEAAQFMARASHAALEDGNRREALARALRGLSLAPHQPRLWYLVASACFEFGAVEDAVRALRHTLWIQPGHRPAKRDLAALNLYLRDRWETPGEMSQYPDSEFDSQQANPGDPDLAFDLVDKSFDQLPPTNSSASSEDDPPRPDAEEEHDSDE